MGLYTLKFEILLYIYKNIKLTKFALDCMHFVGNLHKNVTFHFSHLHKN